MSTTVTYKGETLTSVSNNTKILKTSGKYMEDDVTLVDVSQVSPSLQAKTNINPSTSSQTIEADSGYDGLSSVQINAMPVLTLPTSTAGSATSGYISKATVSRSTSDQYINIGTGYNSAGAYYKISAITNGTEGTPTATKGTVSNNSISITPSVTNTEGYISGSTKTGTAVTVSASELVSGNKAITENGTNIDVTNYATVSVNVAGNAIISDTLDSHGGTIRTITTGQTLNLQSKTVTPTSSQQTITPDTGYNGLSEVIVGAVSGGYITQDANGHIVLPPTGDIPTLITKTITQNGTYAASSDNASGYSNVSVNVSPNLTTKSITANGTYNASSDSVDGYSQVTVNVPTVMNVISTSATERTTLTFNNIQKQPNQFVVVLADFIVTPGYATKITVHSNEIPYIYYNGTSTNALYTSIASSSLTLWELDSGILTWAYSRTQKKLTFTISNTNGTYIYFNLKENGGKYVLYYV